MEHTSIPELIEKSIAGERGAQEALIRATQNHIYYHCVKMLKREADAQDMAQEILIAMLKQLPQLREPAAFWSWLNAITANQCRRALAREGRGRRRRRTAGPQGGPSAGSRPAGRCGGGRCPAGLSASSDRRSHPQRASGNGKHPAGA